MTALLNAAVVDDEPPALQVLKSYIARTPTLHLIGAFADATEAVPFINRHPIDLVFMDMEMPDLSGLDALRRLHGTPLVIVTTAHREYAIPSFAFRTVDYLLKPISFAEFSRSVEKAVAFQLSLKPGRTRRVRIKSGYEEHAVPTDHLTMLKSAGNYVEYHSVNRPVLLSLQTMPEALSALPEHFVRVHRSYAVNLDRVETVGRDRLTVFGEDIPIGDAYKEAFFRRLRH